jgi:putative hemolysin
MNIRRNSMVIAVAAIMPFAAACGSGDSPSTTEPTSGSDDSSQIANPASEFCIEQGGTLEIVDETDGQVGYCTLPDGTRVEEWEYYRSQNPDMEDSGSELPGDGVE